MKDRSKRLTRGIALVAAGMIAGSLLLSPATAHVNSPLTFKHLKKHFYTKSQSNSRFINVGEKATSAANADNAALVNNTQVVPFNYQSSAVVTKNTVLSVNGLLLQVSCDGTNPTVYADTTVANGDFSSWVQRIGLGNAQVEDDDFDPGDDWDLHPAITGQDLVGELRYQGGDGKVVTVNWGAEDNSAAGECVVFGYAVS